MTPDYDIYHFYSKMVPTEVSPCRQITHLNASFPISHSSWPPKFQLICDEWMPQVIHYSMKQKCVTNAIFIKIINNFNVVNAYYNYKDDEAILHLPHYHVIMKEIKPRRFIGYSLQVISFYNALHNHMILTLHWGSPYNEIKPDRHWPLLWSSKPIGIHHIGFSMISAPIDILDILSRRKDALRES